MPPLNSNCGKTIEINPQWIIFFFDDNSPGKKIKEKKEFK
jgi:hypothetical protein